MSAFIIGKQTMDQVVTAILSVGYFGGQSIEGDVKATSLGRRLFAMNIDAVLRRYPNDTLDSAPGPVDKLDVGESYVYEAEIGGPTAGLKAMHCLSYQCSEGDVPDSDLFKELGASIGEVADMIVTDTAEYDEAPWD